MKKKIFDVHTHLGTGGAFTSRVEELIASMNESGVDRACVFAGEIGQLRTQDLLGVVSGYTQRLFPLASISPDISPLPDVELFKNALKNCLIYGLKLYVGYEYFFPNDERLYPYYRALSDAGKPVVFHSGDTYCKIGRAKLKYAHPIHIDDLAVEFPDLKIIIAHMGYPWQIDAGEVCYKNKNVYTDLSGFVYGEFTKISTDHFSRVVNSFLEIAGREDALLFGTDWPIGEMKSYVEACELVLPARMREDVFWKTAHRVFGIEK